MLPQYTHTYLLLQNAAYERERIAHDFRAGDENSWFQQTQTLWNRVVAVVWQPASHAKMHQQRSVRQRQSGSVNEAERGRSSATLIAR